MSLPLSENGLRPSPVQQEVMYSASVANQKPLWHVHITATNDKSSYLSNVPSGFKEKKDFASLEELTTEVYNERVKKHGPPQLSKDNPMAQMCNIAHSATPRYDLIARPVPSPEFLGSLDLEPRAIDQLPTWHIMYKNGLNNASFIAADGTKVELTTAIAGSSDRESEKLPMARKVAPYTEGETAKEAPSYCYTGRPDTKEKALEQAQMIFFSEIESSHSKGLKETTDEKGGTIYELTYVVNSLQSNSPLYGVARAFRGKGQAPEHILFQQEQTALESLKKNAQGEDVIHIFKDPEGKEYRVKLKPILFSRQVNMFANLEKTLESSISGEKAALKATRTGWKELKTLAQDKLNHLNPKDRSLAKQLIERLDYSHNGRWIGAQASAEEELFYRALLVLILDLPVVYHCKSSIDRTSIFVALHVSLAQWKSLGKPFVDKEEKLLMVIDQPGFKELFAMNWVQGHQISRNARSAEGVISDGKKTVEIDGEIMTIFAGKGLDQCPPLARLLPESYLKAYGPSGFFFEKNAKEVIKNFTLFLGAIAIESLLLPFLTLLNPNGTLSTPESAPAHLIISLLRYPFMLIKNYFNLFFKFFNNAIPKKVIDPDHADIGKRHLIEATPKYQTAFTSPIKAVPANAKSIEEYKYLFDKRFNQIARRPIRHTIYGNGFQPKDQIAPSHHFLGKILTNPNLEITLKTQFIENKEDEKKKTITSVHLHTIKIEGSEYVIKSETILNADEKSPNYGQGVIDYFLYKSDEKLNLN